MATLTVTDRIGWMKERPIMMTQIQSTHLEVAVLGDPGDRDLLLAMESPNLTRRPFLIENERSR